MKLDLSSLDKAVDSLDRTLKVAADGGFMDALSGDQKDAVRAGVIQTVDVPPQHIETIKKILAAYVPGREVRAFGSRVTGVAEVTSDLDLAVMGEGRLDRRTKMLLREAFEESDLPFRVDVLDYNAIADGFQAVVDRQYEVVQGGEKREEKADVAGFD